MTDIEIRAGGGLVQAPRQGWLRVAEHRVRTMRSFASTVVLTSLGNPLIYLAAMGVGLGAMIRKPIDNVSYLTFVAPALVVSTVVTTAAGEGMFPVMSGFKWEKFFFAASASPLEPAEIANGHAVAVSLQLFAQALCFWLIGLLFGAFHAVESLLIVPIATLAGASFLTPLMAYSATLKEEGLEFNLIMRLIVNPMFLFAGTFFPLTSMPVFLRWIGWISPIWHASQLGRLVSYGLREPAWLSWLHVLFLLVVTLGGLALARLTFRRRLIE